MNKEKIIKKYSSICYTCNHSRKVCDANLKNGYVGCCGRVLPFPYSFDYDVIENGYEVAEGWVYLKCKPFVKYDNTIDSGIITNFQLITKMIKSCRKYEPKTNY